MEFEGDDHCILDCIVDDDRVERLKFEREMIEHIQNPTYLLIGIMSGPGFVQANFVDGTEFEKLFEKHWKELVH